MKVTKVRAGGARDVGCWPTQTKKYVRPAKTQFGLHLCRARVPVSRCMPAKKTDDADQTTRTAYSDPSLPRTHRSFCRFCLGLAVSWLIFKRTFLYFSPNEKLFTFLQMKSKKISNDQELIQSDPISRPQNQKGNTKYIN